MSNDLEKFKAVLAEQNRMRQEHERQRIERMNRIAADPMNPKHQVHSQSQTYTILHFDISFIFFPFFIEVCGLLARPKR